MIFISWRSKLEFLANFKNFENFQEASQKVLQKLFYLRFLIQVMTKTSKILAEWKNDFWSSSRLKSWILFDIVFKKKILEWDFQCNFNLLTKKFFFRFFCWICNFELEKNLIKKNRKSSWNFFLHSKFLSDEKAWRIFGDRAIRERESLVGTIFLWNISKKISRKNSKSLEKSWTWHKIQLILIWKQFLVLLFFLLFADGEKKKTIINWFGLNWILSVTSDA